MRDPKKYTIAEILSLIDTQIIVPKYQRGYDWRSDREVQDLFSDIFDCVSSDQNKDLFLGTMIFDISNEKKKGSIEIIDGQQRLMTIYIVLIACRVFAMKILNNKTFAHDIQKQIISMDELQEKQDFKFIASASIRDVFEEMAGASWEGNFEDSIKKNHRTKHVKLQNRRLKPIFDFAYSEITSHCSGDPFEKFKIFLKQLYYTTYIIRIDVEEKEEAFEIFERTNARGKGLEIADLLKNFLFSKNKELDVKNIEKLWEEIVENSGNSMLRMLKYFWVSRRGHVSSRDLYRNIRNYAREVDINTFVEELQEFSMFYKAFVSKNRNALGDWMSKNKFDSNDMYLNEASRAIAALKLFGVTQTMPLVFSSFKSFMSSKNAKSKDYLTFLRLLEAYHFVNNKICNRVGNEVEKIYAEYSRLFYTSNKYKKISKELTKSLLEKMAKRDEFVASFSGISYDNVTDKPIIHYIFDQISNYKIKDGQRQDLINYYSIENKRRRSFDIEHLNSQSNFDKKKIPDYVHEVGNLFVIARQVNGILQNKPFSEKIDIFRHPEKYKNNIKNIPGYLREFALQNKDKKEWAEEDINNRTKLLAIESYQIAAEGYVYK